MIPTIITQLAQGNRVLKLGALDPTRDFSFIADIVDGFIAVAKAEHALGEVINIGSSFEISIGDTAQLIADVMGKTIDIATDETRVRPAHSEVARLFAGTEKARTLLDWQPHYAGREGLRRGLTETCAWFQEKSNLALYKPDVYNI